MNAVRLPLYMYYEVSLPFHCCKGCLMEFIIGHFYTLDTKIFSDVVFGIHLYNCCSIIKLVYVVYTVLDGNVCNESVKTSYLFYNFLS